MKVLIIISIFCSLISNSYSAGKCPSLTEFLLEYAKNQNIKMPESINILSKHFETDSENKDFINQMTKSIISIQNAEDNYKVDYNNLSKRLSFGQMSSEDQKHNIWHNDEIANTIVLANYYGDHLNFLTKSNGTLHLILDKFSFNYPVEQISANEIEKVKAVIKKKFYYVLASMVQSAITRRENSQKPINELILTVKLPHLNNIDLLPMSTGLHITKAELKEVNRILRASINNDLKETFGLERITHNEVSNVLRNIGTPEFPGTKFTLMQLIYQISGTKEESKIIETSINSSKYARTLQLKNQANQSFLNSDTPELTREFTHGHYSHIFEDEELLKSSLTIRLKFKN